MTSDKYTYAQKRIALIAAISRVDNKLIHETHPGNRQALETELGVLREILENLHDTLAQNEAP